MIRTAGVSLMKKCLLFSFAETGKNCYYGIESILLYN